VLLSQRTKTLINAVSETLRRQATLIADASFLQAFNDAKARISQMSVRFVWDWRSGGLLRKTSGFPRDCELKNHNGVAGLLARSLPLCS
jgi:hypothetical protein